MQHIAKLEYGPVARLTRSTRRPERPSVRLFQVGQNHASHLGVTPWYSVKQYERHLKKMPVNIHFTVRLSKSKYNNVALFLVHCLTLLRSHRKGRPKTGLIAAIRCVFVQLHKPQCSNACQLAVLTNCRPPPPLLHSTVAATPQI